VYLGSVGEAIVAKNLIPVIDDDESVRRTTTRLIESFGFRSAAFESAEKFLSSGQLDDASCLIVDLQMPGMNGLQLQSQLAMAGCRVPVIFITAYDDKESRRRAMQAGAIAFLGKPFSDEQLLQGIRLALDEFDDEPRAEKNLISIIDDDESARRTTARLIESFDLRAAAFESAESFLSSGQLDCSSCLIVDVRMPGMNGLQLQSQLAAAGCRIPIIFITAYDDQESCRRAMQAGAIAFLGKPFADEHLLQSIRSALRQEKSGMAAT
jgi:FixJ family two-component response regulator